MNRRLNWAVFGVLAVFLLPSFAGVADTDFLPPDSGIVVDLHWMDLLQDDNLKSFEISETLFFNNTGDGAFNGTVYVWIPSGATIRANCCEGTLDMTCRLVEDGPMTCYSVWQIEENIVSISPFSASQLLSFYGQRASLNLSILSQTNSSNVDHLPLTIEVGGSSVAAGAGNTSARKIHLISENSTFGASQQFETIYPPLNYYYVQKQEVFNNGNESDIFDLDIEGIPVGWQVSFSLSGANITSISVQPSERLEIDLVIEIPSHVASVFVEYEMDLGRGGNEKVTTSFEKRFLYDSDKVEIYVFLLEGSTLDEGSNVTMTHPPPGQEPIWNEPNGRYWYILSSSGLPAGALTEMKISWVVETDFLPYVLLVAFAGLMIFLIGFPILRKRKLKSEGSVDSDSDQREDAPIAEAGSRSHDVGSLDMAMERVERDLEKGLISKEQAALLTSRLRGRTTIKPHSGSKKDGTIAESETVAPKGGALSEHVTQLGTLKQIVKELDAQHRDGRLPDDIHRDLRDDYDTKIEAIQNKMESSALLNSQKDPLTRKKEKMLEAIERLRIDFES
ncbi:MAG: hypothetical protein V3U09_05800, partial [Thermoplasmata archaeon]